RDAPHRGERRNCETNLVARLGNRRRRGETRETNRVEQWMLRDEGLLSRRNCVEVKTALGIRREGTTRTGDGHERIAERAAAEAVEHNSAHRREPALSVCGNHRR